RSTLRTSHERGVLHSVDLDDVHILSATRDEARVLTALDRLPEQPFLGDGSHGVPSLLSGHMFGGPLDRLHDVVVAGAATEVALELVADLLFRRLRIPLEQLVGGPDHTRRAEAGLETVLLPEPLLDRMTLAVPREAIDCRYGGAVGLDREHRARLHRLAVR